MIIWIPHIIVIRLFPKMCDLLTNKQSIPRGSQFSSYSSRRLVETGLDCNGQKMCWKNRLNVWRCQLLSFLSFCKPFDGPVEKLVCNIFLQHPLPSACCFTVLDISPALAPAPSSPLWQPSQLTKFLLAAHHPLACPDTVVPRVALGSRSMKLPK